MLLTELSRPDLIKVALDAQNKREAISELVDVLVQQHEVPMIRRSDVLEAVLANERAQVSGMERGIAVPHGTTDKVDDILAALGTSHKGIPFDTRDGSPADLVILVVAPKRNRVGEIRALAGIEHLLKDHTLKQKIVAAKSPGEIFKIIEQAEQAEV